MRHAGQLYVIPTVARVALAAARSARERVVYAMHLGAVFHARLLAPRAAESGNFVQVPAFFTGCAHVSFALRAVFRALWGRRRWPVASLRGV